MNKKTSTEQQSNETHDGSRRRFIKGAAYMAPVIVTLVANPSIASAGSPGVTQDPRPNPGV